MTADVMVHPGVIDQFSHEVDGQWVPTPLSNGFIEPGGDHVERWFQAYKTLDLKERARILSLPQPFGRKGAKAAGRKVKLRSDWEQVKFQLMSRFVLRKFLRHPGLAQYLLNTGDALLIEGNIWHDNTWGDCRCGKQAECEPPGLNWLGQILMTVREILRQSVTPL